MRRFTPIGLLLLGLTLATVPTWADNESQDSLGSELVLVDDSVLQGTTVERDGDYYLLELEGGEILTIPVSLVVLVRLTAGEEEPEDPKPAPTGFKVTGGEELVGSPPTAVDDEPRSYPKIAEQLGVFDNPTRFRRSPTNPFWRPRSDWDLDPSQNDFNPARWAEPSIRPFWEPRSAFDGRVDVLESSRTGWSSSFGGFHWAPRDGFGSPTRLSLFD